MVPSEGFSFPSWQVPLSLLVTPRLRFPPGQAPEMPAGFLQQKMLPSLCLQMVLVQDTLVMATLGKQVGRRRNSPSIEKGLLAGGNGLKDSGFLFGTSLEITPSVLEIVHPVSFIIGVSLPLPLLPLYHMIKMV